MITITKSHAGVITIKDDNGNKTNYYGYSRRDALSQFRHENGLRGKRLQVINY